MTAYPSRLSLVIRHASCMVLAVLFAGATGLVQGAAPAAPTNVKSYMTRDAAGTDRTYWYVTWDDNAQDEAGYLVKGRYLIGGQPASGYLDFATESQDATSTVLTLSDLVTTYPNLAIQFQVVAFKNNGNKVETRVSANQSTTEFASIRTFAPPTGLKVTKVAGSDGSYEIEWPDTSTTEIYHRLGFKKGGEPWDANNEFQLGLFGKNLVRTELLLVPNTQYTFRLRSQRFTPEPTLTDYSPLFVLTTDPLTAPSGLVATALDETTVRLNWSDNSTNTMGYELQFLLGTSGTFQPLKDGSNNIIYTGGDATSYEITVAPGSTLKWRVRGVFRDSSLTLHHSDFSNEASVTTAFPVPTGVAALPTGLAGSIAVKWTNQYEGTREFQVVGRAADSSDPFSTLATVPASVSETLITGLTVDQTMEVGVVAVAEGALSDRGATVAVTPANGFSPGAYVANLDPAQFGMVLLTPLETGGAAAQEVIKGAAFTHTVSITDAAGRQEWSVAGLPGGFAAFDSNSGVITGTPVASGVVQSLMTVHYTSGVTATAKMVFRIQEPVTAPVVTQAIAARTIGKSATLELPLTGVFSDPDTPRAVRFETSLGEVDLALWENVTPQAVANFLAYVNGGDYNGVAFHRTFPPGSGPNHSVHAVVVAPDGRLLLGGDFTTYNATATFPRVMRVGVDGVPDSSFNPGAGADALVRSLVREPGGKVLIGGDFTTYRGTDRARIARINADGNLDTGFDPGLGADGTVSAIAVRSDGKVLIGGTFANYNEAPVQRLARLGSDGVLDTNFDAGLGADGEISQIVVLPDNKLLIAGAFTLYDGTPRNGIARLLEDGDLDTTFDPGDGAQGAVHAVVRLADGKLLIAGAFSQFAGVARAGVARLMENGGLDLGFSPGAGADAAVFALAVQADGKILIGGDFTNYDGVAASRIARLESDGGLDPAGFNTGAGADGKVTAIAVQADGKVVMGGDFSGYRGQPRSHLARLNADGSLDTGFNAGFVVQGGGFKPVTAPNQFASVAERPSPRNEPGVANRRGIVAAAKIGFAPDSATHDFFLNLGDNRSNLDLQNSGFTAFGRVLNDGMDIVDAISGLPTSTYDVLVDGMAASYSNWPMNDSTAPPEMDISKTVKIVNAVEIAPLSFAVTANTDPAAVEAVIEEGKLLLTGLEDGTADVTILATDLDGNTVSHNVTVTVVDGHVHPAIVSQPQSQLVPPGTEVTLTVDASGTGLSYQWRKGGQPIDLATNRFLALGPAGVSAEGNYDVVISSPTATLISSVATVKLSYAASVGGSAGSQLVRTGQPLTLSVNVSGVPVPTVTWTRNDQPLAATGPVLSIAAATLTDAGVYRARVDNGLAAVDANPVSVVVVDATPKKVIVKSGGKTSLAVTVAKPPGVTLSYRWKSNATNPDGIMDDVQEGLRFAGVTQSRLSVRGVSPPDPDYFTCLVTWPEVMTSVSSGVFDVIVSSAPVVSAFTMPDAVVGQDYEFFIPVDAARTRTSTSFTAIGLPGGLKLEAAKGRIYGRPVVAGTFTVKVRASNPAGTSAQVASSLRVTPLPSNATGAFVGLLARQSNVNEDCGGRVDLAVTDNAAFSGKIALPTGTYNIRGPVTRAIQTIGNAPTTVITGATTITRKGKPTLTFNFSVNAATGDLSGDLRTDASNKAGLFGWKNFWHATYLPPAEFGYVGTYHIGMTIPAGDAGSPTVPQGAGYAAVTVSTSGLTTVKGKTIDGKTLLCSAPLGPAGSLMVFQQLYKKTGSLLGPLAIVQRDADLNGGISHAEIVTVNGFPFDQFKRAQAAGVRDYVAGFAPPVPLTVKGGTFVKPPTLAEPTGLRNALTKLSAGGAELMNFGTGVRADHAILSMAAQADGKILIAGIFSRYGEVSRNGVARLLPSGALDPTFDPGTGANAAVYDIKVQGDGKILIAGAFTQFGGVVRNRVARLDPDGSLDASFDPGNGPNGTVESIAIQGDSKVMIAGQFGLVSGVNKSGIARLTVDGTIDPSFNASGTGTNAGVKRVVIQPDQQILIGGDFTSYNHSGTPASIARIARLNPNGTLDTSFTPGAGATSSVRAIAVDPDGKIIIGGSFTRYNGVLRRGVARLSSAGVLDTTFDVGSGALGAQTFPSDRPFDATVFAISRRSDGRYVVGGDFDVFNTSDRNGLVLLDSNGAVSASMVPPRKRYNEPNNKTRDKQMVFNTGNTIQSLLVDATLSEVIAGGWVWVKTEADRLLGLRPSGNQARVNFTQGKLETGPDPSLTFAVSSLNVGTPAETNNQGTTWTYSATTGILSGRFTLTNGDVPRTAKYSALLVPVSPGDYRGMGSFDLAELPNGTTTTKQNSPIHTGKVVVVPVP
jgi:uncharacterized delta-60 repeat protein